MDPLRAIPPLIVSLPVTEPVQRVKERREEPEHRHQAKPETPEAETTNDGEEHRVDTLAQLALTDDPDGSGQHIDTEV